VVASLYRSFPPETCLLLGNVWALPVSGKDTEFPVNLPRLTPDTTFQPIHAHHVSGEFARAKYSLNRVREDIANDIWIFEKTMVRVAALSTTTTLSGLFGNIQKRMLFEEIANSTQ